MKYFILLVTLSGVYLLFTFTAVEHILKATDQNSDMEIVLDLLPPCLLFLAYAKIFWGMTKKLSSPMTRGLVAFVSSALLLWGVLELLPFLHLFLYGIEG